MCAGICILTIISGDADAVHTKKNDTWGTTEVNNDIHPMTKRESEFLNIIQSQRGQASPTKMTEWPARPESYQPAEGR